MTSFAKLVRNSASSTAVLPPPTTATCFPLKKKPSQVAHAETPKPLSFSSLGKAEPLRLRAGRDDQRVGRIARSGIAGEDERTLREIDGGDQVERHLGADMLGLGLHLLHQPGALDGVA